ncbi:hypothetical protein VU07_05365, partial [Desulfobulbus sp. F4]|nr:hypothetical protein [Desulfobulbus sp. F4]
SQQSKMESCVVNVSGDTLTITNSGGVGDNIVWTVLATDQSGNTATAKGNVLVANPGNARGKGNNGCRQRSRPAASGQSSSKRRARYQHRQSGAQREEVATAVFA